MIRTFVALIIPEEIINQILDVRKRVLPEDGNYRWEDNSRIHLTLKFIGDIKENLLESIIDELNFLQTYNKIICCTEKFGFFFKSKDEPRILWFGLRVDNSLHKIVEELNQRMVKFSIPIEQRKFKAHLTLLRIKTTVTKDFIDGFLNANFPQINFVSGEIVLMKSELSPKGSTYTEIKKYYLK
jgi:2'-5' RNA ligase